MLQAFPNSDVIVFGHLHVPCDLHLRKILFNPGSTSTWPRTSHTTFELLHPDEVEHPMVKLSP
jgi:predicted phosphodiesterase